MIQYFLSSGESVRALPQPAAGCWICVTDPTAAEQIYLTETLRIHPAFVRASLDQEETSRIDREEDWDQTLVIADYPGLSDDTGTIVSFITQPIGIILCKDWIVTVSGEQPHWLKLMEEGKVKSMDTRLHTRFLLLVLLQISQQYLFFLRQIEKASNQTTARLYKGMKNRELLSMLELDKSLIYFNTSLKAEEMTLRRIMRGKDIPFYEDDRDLLEDVQIEFRQAEEMCSIYSSINSQTMDGFSNVINNSMNDTMKELTIITIVMSIPNMVYGFYGMNVEGLPIPVTWFPLVLSIGASLAVWVWFAKTNKF